MAKEFGTTIRGVECVAMTHNSSGRAGCSYGVSKASHGCKGVESSSNYSHRLIEIFSSGINMHMWYEHWFTLSRYHTAKLTGSALHREAITI